MSTIAIATRIQTMVIIMIRAASQKQSYCPLLGFSRGKLHLQSRNPYPDACIAQPPSESQQRRSSTSETGEGGSTLVWLAGNGFVQMAIAATTRMMAIASPSYFRM